MLSSELRLHRSQILSITIHWTSLSFLLASGIPIHRSGDLYRLCIGLDPLETADQLFDKSPHPMAAAKALFKWKLTTSQVQQLIRAEKDVQKALRIFDLATAEYSNGYKHDHSTFHIMISKLLSVNQFKPAEEMLDRMKTEKCEITEDIFLSICRAYGRVPVIKYLVNGLIKA